MRIFHHLLLLAVAMPAFAVQITDTLTRPDGTLANGTLIFTVVTPTFSPSVTYAHMRRSLTVTNGAVSINLVANTTLVPAGTLYRVDYQLQQTGGNVTEYWNIPVGGPFTIRDVRWRNRTPTGYGPVNMSGTTWTVPAAVHGIRTRAMTVHAFDGSGNKIDGAFAVHPSTFAVTAQFGISVTGALAINAISSWSGQVALKEFASASTWAFLATEHRLGTRPTDIQCWSTAGAEIGCAVTSNPSSYDITVTLASAQAGYLTASAR